MQPVPEKLKPLLRGHFHQAAFFIAIGACAMLLAHTPNSLAFTTAFIYSLSLIGMFGISALYHRPKWRDDYRQFMRRLDHAAIFLLIAGTHTPIFILSLDAHAGRVASVEIWVAAAIGIAQTVLWPKAPKCVSVGLYILCGWLAFPYLSEIAGKLGESSVFLLLSGGVIYTLGALVYAFKRPNPHPGILGYHEIFHIMVILAAGLHFMVVSRLVN